MLDYRKEAPEWVNWETLLRSGTENWFPSAAVRHCSSYIQSISLALDGEGAGLGVLPMLSQEMKSGKLAVLGDRQMNTGHSYYLATPDVKSVTPATGELISFLLDGSRDWAEWAG